jgi:hypothetical protein
MKIFPSKNTKNNVNRKRYLERNEKFKDFQPGNLVVIDIEKDIFSNRKFKLRKVLNTEKGFSYIDCGKPRIQSSDTFYAGNMGIYLGRYDGSAVVMFEKTLYSIPIFWLKKV